MSPADQDHLSDSQISSLLNGRERSPEFRLLERISGSKPEQRQARERIERALSLPGLFLCQSKAQVLALIDERDLDGAKLEPKIQVVQTGARDEGFLINEEIECLKELADDLINSNVPVFHWSSPFHSGASHISNSLSSLDSIQEHFKQIAYIRPSEFDSPFQREFRSLAQLVETSTLIVNTRGLLVDSVRAQGMLVVLHSAFAIDSAKDDSWVKQVIKELKGRSLNWVGPSALLVVGESAWVAKVTGGISKMASDRLDRTLRVRGGRRFSEFKRQWERFGDLRGKVRSEESGSRMRRMATYYSRQKKKEVWPVSIKIRALFASNFSTFSYFDPTQGFKRLAGGNFDRISDIESYHRDITEYIGFQRFLDQVGISEGRGSRTYYYNLQYVSTALNWLTDEALTCLLGKIPGIRPNALRLETEVSRISSFLPVINRSVSVVDTRRHGRFFAGLSIKAVIQDLWAADEPYERSLAHWRIAKRLLDNQHDKDLLAREFPYPAQWGRSRIFFLGEAVRHLVRSCETSLRGLDNSTWESGLQMPEEPLVEVKGTSPSQVVNFCFETIFQKELNGNAGKQKSRKLAKQYGAYNLAVELLELMSEDYEIGRPHPSLRPDNHVSFVRECAFALLDIGELARAEDCFQRAIALTASKDDVLQGLDLQLDLALLKTVSGAVSDAQVILDCCRERVEQVHLALITDNPNSLLAIRKMFRRLIGRNAHLKYVKGDVLGALHEIERISSERLWEHLKVRGAYPRNILVPSFSKSLQAEQEHLLIACLMAKAKDQTVESSSDPFGRALDACVSALMKAQSAGMQHEAMGFRIVLARLMRRMGRPSTAEKILDVVHGDILKFGCSERTFLAFLNVAGKVLCDLGQPLRAFATYIWPCMWRASSRGFNREAAQAAASAAETLEACYRVFCSRGSGTHADDLWTDCVQQALTGHQRLLEEFEDILEGGPFEKDPLYAYAVVDAENLIRSMRSEQDFMYLQSQIESVLQRHSA